MLKKLFRTALAAGLCACSWAGITEAAEISPSENAAASAVKTESAMQPEDVSPALPQNTESAPDFSLEKPETPAKERKHETEIQLEYGQHRFFGERHIDDYTVHYFERFHKDGPWSFYKGVTLERGVGHTDDGGVYRKSNAWGIGPALMVRWMRPLGHTDSKWSAGIEGKGSILAYNRAFPARGRAFGFQWGIGPRVAYHMNKKDDISLAYLFKHNSNGFKHHNPGYNTIGFSLAYTHRW